MSIPQQKNAEGSFDNPSMIPYQRTNVDFVHHQSRTMLPNHYSIQIVALNNGLDMTNMFDMKACCIQEIVDGTTFL